MRKITHLDRAKDFEKDLLSLAITGWVIKRTVVTPFECHVYIYNDKHTNLYACAYFAKDGDDFVVFDKNTGLACGA